MRNESEYKTQGFAWEPRGSPFRKGHLEKGTGDEAHAALLSIATHGISQYIPSECH